MSTEQHEALKLADGLEQRRITNWVNSTGETPRASGLLPDRECNKAAAMLRTQHALIVQMAKALEKIAAIENQEYGADWEEIEEAREIAEAVIPAATQYLKGQQ